MSLQDAKNKLEQNKKETEIIDRLINPQKTTKPKFKIPPRKDISQIEQILKDKLNEKKEKITENIVNQANRKYADEIKIFHERAIELKKDVKDFAKKVETENNNNIESVLENRGYSSHYLAGLPDDIKEATEDKFFQLADEPGQIEEMRKEINEFLLNVKIGIQPLSDVKPLLDKINLM